MQTILITLTIVAALVLILLVSLLPRENQQFYRETNTSIGKSGYWETHLAKKILVLLIHMDYLVYMIIVTPLRNLNRC